MFLIERYANFLVGQGNHKEAAWWFRKIDRPYFELIARINDLLAEGQTDIKIVKAYLFEIVEKNQDLKNIALLKVALYAKAKGIIIMHIICLEKLICMRWMILHKIY